MGVFAGPDVSENGLVLALDAANQKSLNIPTQADHGYADWYCLVTGTATYSIISSTGGIIYENNAGTITALVTATGPQRGTITVTAGRTYYGSVPINLVVESEQQSIAPLTIVGTQFWYLAGRASAPPTIIYYPTTYYVYSPYQAATVNFYDGVATGLAGTPTSTLSLSAGQSGTFTTSTETNHWISSNVPILATATRLGVDKTILSPMSTYVYQRYQNNINTTNNTTPTNNNTYVTYDSTYKVMNMNIADGGGGDCAQGLGLEYLSDTYSWGNVVSDYAIAAPYSATTVTTSYWSGSAWVVWETHSLSGTITSPAYVQRDGTTGVGIAATIISGAAANMASGATLWKWEGTAPFYLCINDNADDEFSVLGWLSSRNTSPRSSNVITDITGRGNNGTLTNGPVLSLGNSGSLIFDGSNDCVVVNSNASILSSTAYTKIAWFNTNNLSASNNIISGGNSGQHAFWLASSNKLQSGHNSSWSTVISTTTISANTWYCGAVTFNTTSGWNLYLNGALENTNASTTTFTGNGEILIGAFGTGTNVFSGNISNVQAYNRVLTASEIQQNFNANRGRFGI